jgi:hypothetical protein
MLKVQIQVPKDAVKRQSHLRNPPTIWRTVMTTKRHAVAEKVALRIRQDINDAARVRIVPISL